MCSAARNTEENTADVVADPGHSVRVTNTLSNPIPVFFVPTYPATGPSQGGRPSGDRTDPQDDAPGSSPRVVLRARDEGPIVLNREKRRLTYREYNVVKALLDAGERGLTKDELDKKSGHADSRKALRTLRNSDPDWAKVIQMPGQRGQGGYRIK
jgi:hypothetical protein